MHQTTVQIHLYHEGPTANMLDCWVTTPDSPTNSFDPAQLPEEFKKVMEPVTIAALADKATLTTEVANLKAENEAKDANIQKALGQVEQMKAQLAKAEAHIADLSVYEAMAGLTPYTSTIVEPTVTTDADGNVEVTGSGTLSDKTFNG